MSGINFPYIFCHGETVTAAQLDANFTALANKLAALTRSDFRASAAFPNNMKACPYNVTPFSVTLEQFIKEGSGGETYTFKGILGFDPNKLPEGIVQGTNNLIKEVHIVSMSLNCIARSGYVAGDSFYARLNYTDTDGSVSYIDSSVTVNAPALTTVRKWVTDFSVDLTLVTAPSGSGRNHYGIQLIVWTEIEHLR